MKVNTFKFIRQFHRIPQRQKLSWCIIHYPDIPDPARQLRLGVALIGTDKAIDIATGTFIQDHKRSRVILATRRTLGDWYHYESENGPVLRLPRAFTADMYFNRIYSKNLIDSFLL